MSMGNEVSDLGHDAGTTLRYLPSHELGPLFLATVEATEEAIVDALVAAQAMTGQSGQRYTPWIIRHYRTS